VRKAPVLVAVLVAVAVLALTTACDPDDVPVPNESNVDFDTPALREAKRAAGVADCAPGTGKPVDGGLPAITLPCLGGGPDVDLSTLRGPLVVTLWAQSCGPCRTEMPILQGFYEEYGERVGVLGIDYVDTLPGGAIALMDDTGARYPSVADIDGALSAQGPFPVIRGLPYLAFVDADGVVTHIRSGDVESADELEVLVEDHLGIRL
jgi:thiol-disulfide isomerase/thioredoxin